VNHAGIFTRLGRCCPAADSWPGHLYPRSSRRVVPRGFSKWGPEPDRSRRSWGDSCLDVLELNPQFITHLQKRFDQEPGFRCCRDQISLMNSAVEKLEGECTYDFIISGLPLNIFPVEQVREIYRVFSRVLKPGGMLSYFEYILVRQLKSPFVSRRERRRLYRVGRVVGSYISKYQVRRQNVFVNVPPAVVRHLRLKPPVATPLDNGRKEQLVNPPVALPSNADLS